MGNPSTTQIVKFGSADGVFNGGTFRNAKEIIQIRGCGKALPHELRAGLMDASGSLDMIPDATKISTLLGYALYTDGVLGEAGNVDVSSGLQNIQHANAYIESLELSCSVNSAVSASISWRAKTFAAGSVQSLPATFSAQMFDDVGLEDDQEFSISISNDLEVKGKLNSIDVSYILGTGQDITITRVSPTWIAEGGAAATWQLLGYNWTGMVEAGEQPVEERGDVLHTCTLIVDTVAVVGAG